ncbi:MAG: Tim44 domain-containing protein [Alphaproteobacteria bacterium]|nr:Tim44 domain-containing protein [Alphaproteobacteria bacterium]
MSEYLDLIVLGLVVILILMRLYNVLGTRPEKIQIKIVNKQEFEQFYQKLKGEFEDQTAPQIPNTSASKADDVLMQIPSFSKPDFLQRAAKAFEMIVSAFSANDTKTLEMLVAPNLYKKFADIIKSRQEQNLTAETDLIKISEMSIEDAKITAKGVAKIVVKFITDQINVLKNSAGTVIEGDENFVQQITDVWTFEKDMSPASKIWLLTSTKKK